MAEIKRMREHIVSNRSNQRLIKNALSVRVAILRDCSPRIAHRYSTGCLPACSQFVCMAGPRHPERLLVMKLLEKHEGYNFLILLGRGNGLPFRALYVCNHDGSASQRIYGAGPPKLEDRMVETAYKYDCGHKEFRELTTHLIGNTCDAVVMLPHFYKREHSGGKSRKSGGGSAGLNTCPPPRDHITVHSVY